MNALTRRINGKSVQADPLSKEEAEELRFRTHHALLALGMLLSGTANTLTCKAALSVVSNGSKFDHPFVMAACMFTGEIVCLAFHTISGCCSRRSSSAAVHVPKHIFALPALCDILGTSIMYVGLTLTDASTYQMLRGSVIIFTGALSAVYLKRKQWGYHWLAMGLVFGGVLTVGSVSALRAQQASVTVETATRVAPSAPPPRPGAALLGDALVVASQLFTAAQMVVEERFVTGYNIPALLAVGWEGVWGLTGTLCLLVALQHYTVGGAASDGALPHPVEDSLLALRQIASQPQLVLLMLANALSIAFFNFFGMSITKTSSAAYRMVLDSLRTLAVCNYRRTRVHLPTLPRLTMPHPTLHHLAGALTSEPLLRYRNFGTLTSGCPRAVSGLIDLALGGGSFHPLQLLGFGLMFTGTAVYNEAFRLDICCQYPNEAERQAARDERASQRARGQPLLGEDKHRRQPPATSPAAATARAALPLMPSPPPPPRIDDILTPSLSRFTMTRHS